MFKIISVQRSPINPPISRVFQVYPMLRIKAPIYQIPHLWNLMNQLLHRKLNDLGTKTNNLYTGELQLKEF